MREIKLQDIVAITEAAGTYTATVVRTPGSNATGTSAEAAVGALCIAHPEVLGILLGADEVPVD